MKEGGAAEGEDDARDQRDEANGAVCGPAWPRYNQPGRIVTLGHYYPRNGVGPAQDLLREPRGEYRTASDADAPVDLGAVRQNLGWTKLLNALGDGRQWPLKRLAALLGER